MISMIYLWHFNQITFLCVLIILFSGMCYISNPSCLPVSQVLKSLSIFAANVDVPRLYIWNIPSCDYYGFTVNHLFSFQSKYCNLGYSLSAADVTGDGHDDLIIGSPYWSRSKDMAQNGFITALPSDKTYAGKAEKLLLHLGICGTSTLTAKYNLLLAKCQMLKVKVTVNRYGDKPVNRIEI